jgi:hypothetical protein
MPSEILSTARPSALRVVGFLVVAAGSVAAGVGATRAWAVVGFPADALGTADVPTHGTDVWEGLVVLLGAALALFALLAMRVAGSDRARRVLAISIVGIGIVCVALPVSDAMRAEDRFAGKEGLDRMISSLAEQSDLPEEAVRELTRQFESQLRVDVEPGLWLAAAGGLLLVAGGALGLAWTRRREPVPAEAEAPPSGDPA